MSSALALQPSRAHLCSLRYVTPQSYDYILRFARRAASPSLSGTLSVVTAFGHADPRGLRCPKAAGIVWYGGDTHNRVQYAAVQGQYRCYPREGSVTPLHICTVASTRVLTFFFYFCLPFLRRPCQNSTELCTAF